LSKEKEKQEKFEISSAQSFNNSDLQERDVISDDNPYITQ